MLLRPRAKSHGAAGSRGGASLAFKTGIGALLVSALLVAAFVPSSSQAGAGSGSSGGRSILSRMTAAAAEVGG